MNAVTSLSSDVINAELRAFLADVVYSESSSVADTDISVKIESFVVGTSGAADSKSGVVEVGRGTRGADSSDGEEIINTDADSVD